MSAGSPRIDVAYFKLFDNCNARCNMCDCWLRPRSGRDVAHYLDVLERVLAARPRSIRFTGGEPLLLRSLPALVAAAAASGARVSVISNGRILPGKVRQLAESGCDEIVLSLDGPRQAHDRIRNTPRLFDKIMESIACIGDARLAYGVNTVVQRETVREVPGMARLLLGQPLTPRWWHLIPVRGQPDLQPSGEDADWLGETLPGVARELAGAGVEVIADAAMFSGRATGRCEVPQFALYVDAESGRAYSCNMLAYADPPIGNLMDSAMEEIWLGTAAMAVRDSCEEGTHAACSRCDTGSMLMNHRLRSQAILAQPLDAMLAVNIRAPHVLVAALAPAMADRGRGVIVTIGSWMAAVGGPFAALYSATKAADEQMTRSWAAEFGPRGVRVNAVAPGATLTPGNEFALSVLKQLTAGTPAGHPVSPEDIAYAVAFLASGEARMIHGITLYVDGGITTTRLG